VWVCCERGSKVGVLRCCGKANAFPQRARATEKGKAVDMVEETDGRVKGASRGD
jgi:hypothetical protein